MNVRSRFGWVLGALVLGLVLVGCDGSDGANGQDTARLSGQVTNATTGGPVAGAVVTTDPVAPGVGAITADANGDYSVVLPIGVYNLTCTDANFVPGEDQISLLAGVAATADFGLEPEAPVIVDITGLPASTVPGQSFNLTAGVTVMDGSTGVTYSWAQTASAQATIANPTSATTGITLGDEDAYITELDDHVEGAGHYWDPLGITPLAMEEAGHTEFTCTVTTSSGTYKESVEVHSTLAFATVSSGLRNVPVGLPVFLNDEEQATYDWMLTVRPGGSGAVLNNATTPHAWFVPDVAGDYEVTVTDVDDGLVTIEIAAGGFEGVIVGARADDTPVSATACTGCHTNPAIVGDDNVTTFADGEQTGHAEIFSYEYNTSGYWGQQCFACHTTGFNLAADNGGIDEAGDYQAFLGTLGNPQPSNFQNMFKTVAQGGTDLPETAKLSNIQCENCHGPQNSTAHTNGGPRVSISSDVCGVCHGEPLRHGRFQQWELSGHSNYELAVDEGWDTTNMEVRSCAACHTGNGFLDWGENGDWDPDYDIPTDLFSGPREIHPQTCVTCHDPHNVGTTTGNGTDAPVRIQGDTPELQAGFTALSVGKGAICMTCHNSRRGLRNDFIDWDALTDKDRAPHGGPQADMTMGQNAYFVQVGVRSAHSFIDNSCVKCHLDLTDPPEELSYNLGGTNHTFYASDEICANCHGAFTAETVKSSTESQLHEVEGMLIHAIYDQLEKLLAESKDVFVGATFDRTTDAWNNDGTRIAAIGDIDLNSDGNPAITLTEYHGRQAMNISVNGTEIPNIQMAGGTRVVSDGADPIKADPTLLDGSNGEILGKAGWNVWLIHGDGSHGIHYPSFTNAILANTAIQLATMDFTPVP
ncbi:MAG: carboxypeptidase-like regulatory domain-containing protein [Planctomycetota bacterium]|jgi:hypothetical protein